MKTVYAVILNWNNWSDTVNCIESVQRLKYAVKKIVICDNSSTDDSIPRLMMQFPEMELIDESDVDGVELTRTDMVLIRNLDNYGYAGGNNVGLRYAMRDGDLDYVWVLNNDVIVEENSLSALLGKFEEETNIGICGSSVFFLKMGISCRRQEDAFITSG